MIFKKCIQILPIVFFCFAKTGEREEFFQSLQITKHHNNFPALSKAQLLLRMILLNKTKNLTNEEKTESALLFYEHSQLDFQFAQIIKLCFKLHSFISFPETDNTKIKDVFNLFSNDMQLEINKTALYKYLSDIQEWIGHDKYAQLKTESIKIVTLMSSIYNAQLYFAKQNSQQTQLFVMVANSIEKYQQQSLIDFLFSSQYFSKLAIKHFDIYIIARLAEIIQNINIETNQKAMIINKLYNIIDILTKQNIGYLTKQNNQSIVINRAKNLPNIDIITELEKIHEKLYNNAITNAETRKLCSSLITSILSLQMYKTYKYKHTANGKTKRFKRFFEELYKPMLEVVDTASRMNGRFQTTILIFVIIPLLITSLVFNIQTVGIPNLSTTQLSTSKHRKLDHAENIINIITSFFYNFNIHQR